jgi:hypothetical protein
MELNPGKYSIQTRKAGDQVFIQCLIRKKELELTPEEFVRQIILHYLHQDQSISLSKIAVEKGFEINGRNKRFDAVIFDNYGDPILLIECKKPGIKLDENVFLQASNYNKHFKAPYLWLSNGAENRLFEVGEKTIELEGFPEIS